MPPGLTAQRSLSTQLLIGAPTLFLWALVGGGRIGLLLPIYLSFWAAENYRLLSKLPLSNIALKRGAWLMLMAGAALTLYRGPLLVFTEGLTNLGTQTQEKLALGGNFAVFPRTLSVDQPQSLYVHAAGAQEVAIRFAGPGEDSDARPVDAMDLGDGLFRVEYDPRHDGVPAPGAGFLDVRVDGSETPVAVHIVRAGVHPRWFSQAPAVGLAATASEETDEVFVVGRSGAPLRVAVGDGPSDTALGPRGSWLAVTHRYDGSVYFIDPHTGEQDGRVAIGPHQHRATVSPDGANLVVARRGPHPELVWIDTATHEVRERTPLDVSPDWLCFGPTEDTLIVSSSRTRVLLRLERRTGGMVVTASRSLSRPVVSMTRSRDGQQVYAPVTGYRPDGANIHGNHFIEDQVMTIDVARLEVVERWRTARGSDTQDEMGDWYGGLSPMAIVVPDNGAILVSFAGSEEVWRHPSRGEDETLLARFEEGTDVFAPLGLADLGEGHWAVASPAGGSIRVVRANGDGETHLLSADRSAEEALLRRGERAFYEGTRAGLSCQSCHLHGGVDHAVHNVDTGVDRPVDTLSVRGISGTAPYLRDGSYPSPSHFFDRVALRRFRGYLREDPERRAALLTFIASLVFETSPRQLSGRDVARERRGRAIFAEADCTRCHSYPAMTNLGVHSPEAIFPEYGKRMHHSEVLDTPTLIGTWATPPYLHDARAASLEEVISEQNPSNLHGDTEALTPTEVADLVYFLEGL